jgi:enamine deaminase RidA (YjgF/YER057c/UK114 family)
MGRLFASLIQPLLQVSRLATYIYIFIIFYHTLTFMSRQNILTGSPWEDKMGYCRAVKLGNIIEVSGTVAIVDGETVKANDAFAQTQNIIARIEKVLEEAGASLKDVVRTRIFTTDISLFDEIARAHGDFFKDIKPATGIYEISKLVSPDYLVEIEFTAIVA